MIDIPTIEEVGTSIASGLSSSYVQALLVPIVFYLVEPDAALFYGAASG